MRIFFIVSFKFRGSSLLTFIYSKQYWYPLRCRSLWSKGENTNQNTKLFNRADSYFRTFQHHFYIRKLNIQNKSLRRSLDETISIFGITSNHTHQRKFAFKLPWMHYDVSNSCTEPAIDYSLVLINGHSNIEDYSCDIMVKKYIQQITCESALLFLSIGLR